MDAAHTGRLRVPCLTRKERERIFRATILEPVSLKPAPAWVAGGQGRRFLLSRIPLQILGLLILNNSTCYLFSYPAACSLLEIYDSFSATSGLLPGETPFMIMVVVML